MKSGAEKEKDVRVDTSLASDRLEYTTHNTNTLVEDSVLLYEKASSDVENLDTDIYNVDYETLEAEQSWINSGNTIPIIEDLHNRQV